jgi:hypothetical protein
MSKTDEETVRGFLNCYPMSAQEASAALDRLMRRVVPEGHTAVPNIPTPFMIGKMQKATNLGTYTLRIMYDAALAAAPQPLAAKIGEQKA